MKPLEQKIFEFTAVEQVGNHFTVWFKVGARLFDLRCDGTKAEAEKERTRLVKALAVLAETVSPTRAARF